MISTTTCRKSNLNVWISILFFFITSFHAYSQQLSGTYSINPSGGGDYISFAEAANALTTKGVNGPVIFNVANGTYSEQVRIGAISGASATNTVTIQSQTSDSADVVLTYASLAAATNWTLRLDSTDYITIREITIEATGSNYGRCIDINANASNVNITNCRLIGYITTSSSDYYALIYSYTDPTDKITIQNNQFSNGSAGVFIQGVNSTTLSTGTKVLNNIFNDQCDFGISLYGQNAPIVNNNTIITKSDPATGISLEYCDNASEVQNNNITIPYGNYGIYIYYSDGTSLQKGKIINNFISIPGGTTACGIYLYNTSFQSVYHNSVNINAFTTNDYGAFYLTGGSNIDVRNNIFANFGGNYAYNIKTPAALAFSDYNDYYSNGDYLGFWTNGVENVSDLKTANSKDVNSVSFNPVFISATDPHATSFRIDNLGTNLGVATDIDGQTRVNNDIGADEFTGSGSFLSGSYTIGTVPSNYTSFSLAAADLNNYGISGPVTFNVKDGSYTEQISISPIAGSDINNPVVFQPLSSDSTKVELSYNSGVNNNYLVQLVGADYVTFRKLNFTSLNSSYSRIFWFSGNAKNITVSGCTLNSDNSGTTADGVFYSYQSNIGNILIKNNIISGGRHAVYLNSNSSTNYLKGNKITNNTISGQRGYTNDVVYLRYNDAPEVSNNTISNTASTDFWGIYLQNCSNDLKVIGNKISSNFSNGGIQLYTCPGLNSKRGLVANNFVDIGGTSTAYGIYTYDADYQNIFNNSVRITSSNTSIGRAYYNNSTSGNITLKNNIFSNLGDGYASYTDGAGTPESLAADYNDYYSTGNNLAYWNGTNQPDLTAFKTAMVTLDVNSISVNPTFFSASDLHSTSSFLNGAGTFLTEVTADIDGEVRNVTTPDIGADEYSTVVTPLAGGTYTIGGSSSSYTTFAAAVNDLNTRGIAGPVVFNVSDGEYNEQISILDINGENATNTITFQSVSGDSSLVTLWYAANLNNKYVIQLLGTDNISFKNMTISATDLTYALCFYFRGGLQKVNIENCSINGFNGYGSDQNSAAIYSGNAVISDLTIKNCEITGGNSAIYLESPSTSYSTNTIIRNNIFSGQYYEGVFLKYHNAPRVENNLFTDETSGSFYGIYLQYCSNDFQVLKNKIDVSTSTGGINIYYCTGSPPKRGLIANNFISVGGSSTAYGIYTSSSDYPRVYNNTVKITSTYANGGIAYYNSNGSFVDVKNNIFSNFGGGYAYYANNSTSVKESDYNDLFTTGNYLGYWGGNYADLTAFKAANGKDTSSVSVNPVFVSATNLHTTSYYLDNKGTHLAAVSTDIDGETRNAGTPDIGADEFIASFLPMTGYFTIGGTAPDFATFSLAAASLNNKGIAGPVTFNVRSGSYNEHFELFEISGASAANTITFQSESGDSSLVSLSYNAPSTVENYVIKLTSADYVTIRNMTIVGTNPTYSNIIVLNGNVTHLKILNNILNLNNNSSGYGIYSADGNNTNDVLIKNNKIIEGGYGIYLDGNNSSLSQVSEISGNILNSQNSRGIYLVDQDGPVIKGNTISSGNSGFYGMYLSNCDNKLVISENKIISDYDNGIYLYYCVGTLVSQGLMANNFITIRGSSYAEGISLYYSEYQNILYNSVNIASTYSNSYPYNKVAFYISGGINNFVKNNIFANTLGGYAYYVNTPGAISESDYNDYYSTTDIAWWGAAKTNLAALKTANNLDAHSISVNPLFLSDTDLRVTQTLLSKAATPIALVTKDFFGNPRDASLPDIGAMEFYCAPPVFNVTTSTTCLNDSTLFKDNSTGIAYGSTYGYDFIDGDFVSDTTFTYGGSAIKLLFTSSGLNTINFIVSQPGGCWNSFPVEVNVKATPLLEVLTTGASCNINNGAASVNVTQATEPFTYLWSNGSVSATANNLAQGRHSVYVKSADNCIGSQTFEIENAIKVTVAQLKPSTCAGSDGSAKATVTGGTLPYTYVWSTGETNDTSITLPSGAQYVNVTDASGCSSLGAINIANDGSGPKINLNSATNNNCFGEKAGSIDVTISGGAVPYNIQWSNGAVTEDISELPAGIYDINVNDNSGCLASASYGIEEPILLKVSKIEADDASCNGFDGKASAWVTGGTEPYKYLWTGGKTGPIAENLSAGVYSLTVTDNKLCSEIIPVLINNTGGPAVTLKTLKGTSCSNANSGAITMNLAGGTPPYTFLWSPGGQTTLNLTNLAIGTHEIQVTDDAGCIGVNSVVVKQDPPQVNPLCMVTVDSFTEKNLVIWEKGNMTDVAAYNVYRESSSKEIFQLIATIPVSEESKYLDLIADPSVRSWKYKLSVVDICGQESDLSPAHKTIHLTQNLGLNSTVNLIWDSYEGFAVSTYNILRHSPKAGWETLTSVPSNLTSYTDLNPPQAENLFYVIEAERPGGACTTFKASTYNSARSNRQSSSVKSTVGINSFNLLNSLSIYPNPASDVLNLRINQNNLKQVRVDIIDVKGQLFQNFKYPANGNQLNSNIDISRIPKGIYILRIESDGIVNYRKLVVEH